MNIKTTATLAALVAASGLTAFGQGYVVFSAAKNNVYDDFTTSGTSVVSSGTVNATFLWAATGTTDPLGAGLATGATTAGGAWATIETMLTSGWSIAQNAGQANAEADVTTGTAITTKGNLSYSGGEFGLTGSTAGSSYEFVVIGWAATGGASLANAENSSAVGWSSAFTYATGASSLATPPTFGNSGEAPFGVAPVPEPASLALAGLGGLSMLFLRRRKA